MKIKWLHLALLLTPLLARLEWGMDQHAFLYQAEGELLSRLFSDPVSALHPLTLLPLAGQILLLITLFQKRVDRKLSLAGLACSAVLPCLMLLVGLLGLNGKMILSLLPFLGAALLVLRYHKKRRARAADLNE